MGRKSQERMTEESLEQRIQRGIAGDYKKPFREISNSFRNSVRESRMARKFREFWHNIEHPY